MMRCLALANMLKNNNINVEFICREHKGNLIDKIRLSGFYVHELDLLEGVEYYGKLSHSYMLGATQKQDANNCINILKSQENDWIVVDHYALDENWHYKLRPYCKRIMVIDDLADRKYQCDILLDQTFGRQKIDYLPLVPSGCELLLGSKYALLRSEFIQWRGYSLRRRFRPQFKRLLINMGGVDINNITGKVVKELQTCILPREVHIIIVMRGKSPHLENVQDIANSLPYEVEIKTDVCNMAEIMANADIAIGASGSSTWERCCMGLPTIQIIIAKNQIFLAKMLESYGLVKLATEINEINSLLSESSRWMGKISRKSSKICSGTGVFKVYNKMSNYKIRLDKFGEVELRNYVNLSVEELALILNMRNHVQVKKWMKSQGDISKKEHIEFISNLENETSMLYFLVKHKNNIIGSINFSQISINNSVEFGIYTNPFARFKGMGSVLELTASQYAFVELGVKEINLKVLSKNERAINFYKKCGYKIIEKKEIKHNSMIYMKKERVSQ